MRHKTKGSSPGRTVLTLARSTFESPLYRIEVSGNGAVSKGADMTLHALVRVRGNRLGGECFVSLDKKSVELVPVQGQSARLVRSR